MLRLIIEFTDGSVNEFLCDSRLEAYSFLRKTKDVKGWEIKEVPNVPGSKYLGVHYAELTPGSEA